MHILVTGGAGYVGSHLVRALLDEGHSVSVIDDLTSGHRATLPEAVPLKVAACGDREALDQLANQRGPDAVMHLAARCSVAESVADPRLYYRANVRDSLRLLDWMVERGVRYIVHSSTCAVYGCPATQPIDEDVCPRPVNPYGATKLAVDQALVAYAEACRIGATTLRYFNAAGAHPEGLLGEDKTPASNLVPRVFEVALGLEEAVQIYGDDYATPDGTGVRDYVHVVDLAAAHIAALSRLVAGSPGSVYNLGTGRGHSVLEVLDAARRVTGEPIAATIVPRRAGDPQTLVADPARAQAELGWSANRSDLETILADAWSWRARHPRGYEAAEVPS